MHIVFVHYLEVKVFLSKFLYFTAALVYYCLYYRDFQIYSRIC